ncbi:MAG: carbohydrate-binding domain-containing protein, partial [Lautropia sp.]|nr:carbohydrate-binding domain-containing protein [Lautropia sp.]
ADYELELANASITSPDGPALNLQSKKTAFIDLQGENTLRDSAAWTKRTTPAGEEMDLKGTLFSEGALVIRGSGSLDISGTPQHALASDGHVRLRSGRVTLTAAAKDGIRANDAFVMDDGTLDIKTPAGKGIKVDGKEDDTQALGFVAINGGNLTINSHDKAITASWEADEDADTPATTDDPDPRVTINGGTLNITTTGPVRNDSDDPPGTNAPSPEGIEAKSVITINNGAITLNTQDDSLNAGTGLYITGGRTYAHSVLNDSLDSNGPMTISGGVLVATSRGPDPEGALDSDSSTFTITGGTFVGLGYYNSTPSADASTQNIVTVTNGLNDAVAPGLWTLRDGNGRAVFAFDIPFAAHYLTLSSPQIADGAAYTVVTGGTLGPVAENFHGLAIEPTTHTGGTAGTSLTTSQRLTALGIPFQWPPAGPAATP